MSQELSESTAITGLKELEDALNGLTVDLERNVVRGALRAGMLVFRDEARARVPVVSGALRDSIRVSVKVIKGVPTATLKAGGKKAGHAGWVEFGTHPHPIASKHGKDLKLKSGKVIKAVMHPGAKKHPFMRPALDAGTERAMTAYREYIIKRLTKQGVILPPAA